MAPYFDKKLGELLPPLYRERDETGDLEAFLNIPATALDELKEHIDRFGDLFDVDRCEARFLPLLGEVVGHRFDPKADAETQRRDIREAIEIYRRKGTLPAIGRALADHRWSGWIEETFRQALRLNRRAVVGRSKLPGTIYSLGAYRVESDAVTPGLRDRLRFHHPAGTRVFFLQWLALLMAMESEVQVFSKERVRRIGLGHLHETFVVGSNALNGSHRLTRTQKTWGLWWVTAGATLLHEVERAGAPLRGPAETLDRGANVRLDQPQPAPRPRLRALCQNRCRLRPSRHDPHHAQAFDTANPLSMNRKFLDRL